MDEYLSSGEDRNAVMDRDDQTILLLLTAIADEPNTTQKDLATRLGVAVGKRRYDKREAIRKREHQREMARQMARRGRSD